MTEEARGFIQASTRRYRLTFFQIVFECQMAL